jgi:hypothetical protein
LERNAEGELVEVPAVTREAGRVRKLPKLCATFWRARSRQGGRAADRCQLTCRYSHIKRQHFTSPHALRRVGISKDFALFSVVFSRRLDLACHLLVGRFSLYEQCAEWQYAS